MVEDGEEMRMNENAPLFTRPASPERKYVLNLADIPEASPGPNAFARQAVRTERHRLESNAFYQQEVQKRKATPPTTLHPALRVGTTSGPASPAIQETPRTAMPPSPQQDLNSARMTVWPGPFPSPEAHRSPELAPLKLVPSDAHLAEPTRRGFLEERQEMRQHERTESTEERVPVFNPTSKTATVDFADPIESTPPTFVECREGGSEHPSKSSKKSFLGRLKLVGGHHRGPLSPSLPSPLGESTSDLKMPVKAQAVLGKSPPKDKRKVTPSPAGFNIPRSPSKRKHFFSRKASSPALSSSADLSTRRPSVDAEPPSSALTKTPPTAVSDPSHFSFQAKRALSHSEKAPGKTKDAGNSCSVARSQSLKYFDHAVPPTPPAKNTPPDQKPPSQPSSRILSRPEQRLPSREPSSIIVTNDSISPTRFGSYGHREVPTLVTRPSVYSLHASVVPSLVEPTTFEEMKARVDALGLEGFSTPAENIRHSRQGPVYSPSDYSVEWARRPPSAFFKNNSAIAELSAVPHHTHEASVYTHGSSSSGGEIPICYPDLAKDPSVNKFWASHTDSVLVDAGNREDQASEEGQRHRPKHGHTRSRDHSPRSRYSADAALFARYAQEDLRDEIRTESPTSFSHASAAPSPLQLQPTVYSPPARKSSRSQAITSIEQGQEYGSQSTGDQTAASAIAIHTHGRTNSASPTRSVNSNASNVVTRANDLFSNAPTFPAFAQSTRMRTPSPQVSIHDSSTCSLEADADMDPRKISPMKKGSRSSDETEKLDRMIDMLNRLHERNKEVENIRDAMVALNGKVERRLAFVDDFQKSVNGSRPSTSAGITSWSAANELSSSSFLRGHSTSPSNHSPLPPPSFPQMASGEHDQRIPTNTAYDFYHNASRPATSGSVSATGSGSQVDRSGTALSAVGGSGATSEAESTDKETLAELKETNKRLLEMVGGFAEKISELEKRVGGG